MHATTTSAQLLSESLLSLGEAARRLPAGRRNRPLSPATVWRWIREGIRLADGSHLKLEGVRIGSRWVTSVEAMGRFAERQTTLYGTKSEHLAVTPTQQAGNAERAELELRKVGI